MQIEFEQFMQDQFEILESVFATKINPATRRLWMASLEKLSISMLRKALTSLCENEDKRPSLAMILRYYRNVNPPTAFSRTVSTTDPRGIKCLWDPDKREYLYRAVDCPEGLAFLSELAKMAGKTPDEMAILLEKWVVKSWPEKRDE